MSLHIPSRVNPDLTIFITGGTGGIGYQTALQLATLGAQVVVSGRSAESGNVAVRELQQASGNRNVHLLLGDLATKAGVRSLAAQYIQQYGHLDVLINNAGLAAPERRLTEDGIEANFAVNVVAPWLLTRLLLPPLRASAAARVVTLTGGNHPSRVELDNLQAERAFLGLEAYSHDKLVMMAIMYALAERMRDTTITVNVCYPGQASTAMTRQVTPAMFPVALRLFWPVFKWATRPDNGASAQRASQSSVYLAVAPDVAGLSGIYIDPRCKKVPWPAAVLDASVRQQLWDYLEALGS